MKWLDDFTRRRYMGAGELCTLIRELGQLDMEGDACKCVSFWLMWSRMRSSALDGGVIWLIVPVDKEWERIVLIYLEYRTLKLNFQWTIVSLSTLPKTPDILSGQNNTNTQQQENLVINNKFSTICKTSILLFHVENFPNNREILTTEVSIVSTNPFASPSIANTNRTITLHLSEEFLGMLGIIMVGCHTDLDAGSWL